MKVTPLADMVLLKPIEQEKVSTGGIIIPDTAKEKPHDGGGCFRRSWRHGRRQGRS